MSEGTVAIALLILGALAWIGVALEERRSKREDERREARHKAAEEEEERLKPKLIELGRLKARAKGERAFLSPAYRERYAYEHWHEVRTRWGKLLDEYDRWEADPDFERLSWRLGLWGMHEIWDAKREVKALADGITEAARQAWQDKQDRLYAEASDRGMTIEEYLEEKQREQKARRP